MKVKRRGLRIVVYRSVREGARVRTQYIGSGLGALGLVEQDLAARIEASRAREQDQEQDRRLDAWDRAVEQLARAVLALAGYRRHHRGQWRHTMDPTTLATQPQPSRHPLSPEVLAIQARIPQGDLCLTSAEARKMIQAVPEFAKLRQTPAGDLLDCLVRRYYPNVLEQELVRHQVEQVRLDLAGPTPTHLEALLAERAAVCWLACNVYERAAESVQDLKLADGMYRQRKIDGAHRRFLSAIKTLATVRKLQLPDLKILVDQRAIHRGRHPSAPGDRVIEIDPR